MYNNKIMMSKYKVRRKEYNSYVGNVQTMRNET